MVKIMEYIENDFAQVEHINQIIANNANHESWDCFDTTELLKQYPQLGNYDSSNPSLSKIIIPDNVLNIRGESVSSHDNIRYNSFIVTISKFKEENTGGELIEYYQYIFEVRNALWDGIYQLTKTTKNDDGEYELFNSSDYSIETGVDENTNNENGNVIILTIKGDSKDSIRMCFHMTMAGSGRNIVVTSLQLILRSEEEFTHQYDTLNYEDASVYLTNKRKPAGVTVTLKPCDDKGRVIQHSKTIGPWIPEQVIENVEGEFEVPYGATSVPGEYYCLLEATSKKNNVEVSVPKIIKVIKVQEEHIEVDWGDDELYNHIWKGCKHLYHIGLKLYNALGVETNNSDRIVGIPVNITFIAKDRSRKSYSTTIEKGTGDEEYYVECEISYRKYYEDLSYLEIEISSEYDFERVLEQRLIKHPWFIAKTYKDIIGQLYLTDSNGNFVDENSNIIGDGLDISTAVLNDRGTDWVFVDCGTYNIDRTLVIPRDFTLASVKGTSQTIFDGNNKAIVHVNYGISDAPNIKVNLIGLTFQNANGAVRNGENTRLLIDRCYFTHNHNSPLHHKGCSIYMPDTDYSRKHHSNWKTEIRNSYFVNNKGNEIQSIGNTVITGNLFKTTGAEYLQQPEVKVVSVRAGTVKYTYNKSYINTGSKPMASNHSFAKALAFVERGATFNGAGPSQLGGDRKLPVFGKYHNQAYTYAIYYYPYSNIRTEIVCSPRKGFERQATGHGSSFKRWIYWDGYYFLRWEHGRNKGNRYDPWTLAELSVPENLGIFDKATEKFIDNYDPRISNSKSIMSVLD